MTKKKDIQIRIITGCISREGGIGCHLGYQNIDFVLEVVVVVVVVVKNLVVVVVIVVVVVSRQLELPRFLEQWVHWLRVFRI